MTTEQVKPAKTNNTAMLIIGASAGILICFACICVALVFSPSNAGETTSTTDIPFFSTDMQAKYVVTGSATSAFITYGNEQGGTEQIEVTLPWIKEMTIPPGTFLSIVAQNNGSGAITCEIWINGEQKKTSTSTAQYGVVTCSDLY